MSCGSCTMGTGASAILVDHISVIIRAAQTSALPSEYVDISAHWDPGFRVVSPKNGAKFILVGGVCGYGSKSVADVDAMDGSRWTLCVPGASFAIPDPGPAAFVPSMMKRASKITTGPHGTGAPTPPVHVNWAGGPGGGPYGSHSDARTMTAIALAEGGGWVPASATLAVPVYYAGGRRARVTVGDTKKVYRVLASKNGGPTGLLVKLGPEVKAFGTGCGKKNILAAQGIGTGSRINHTLGEKEFALAAGAQFGTAGPSRSRHLQRRRR